MISPHPLHTLAQQLLTNPKGILAADEGSKSADKRFAALNIPSSPENRRRYRQMLFTTPGIHEFVSGVILYDETIRQSTDEGQPFPTFLTNQGIIPGIKVDTGLTPFDGFPQETITEGLDGLSLRLKEYYALGARFTKWRAAFSISDTLPTQASLYANAHTLARYASVAQSCGMVPIVEPEVIYDGAHTLADAARVTEEAIRIVMDMLIAYRVDLKGTILKTSMVLAGKQVSTQSSPLEVAQATRATLLEAVHPDIAGIVFLSGGQSPEQARDNLQAINSDSSQMLWPISFSFSRAVQDPAMRAWAGSAANEPAAQKIYLGLTRDCALARQGKFQLPASEAAQAPIEPANVSATQD